MKRHLISTFILLFALISFFQSAQTKSSSAHAPTPGVSAFAFNESDSVIFQDGFELPDSNWWLDEELVDTTWYRKDIGEIMRVNENPCHGSYSFRVWANKQRSLYSNHVNGHYRVLPNSTTGRFIYSVDAYIPMTSDTGQSGPEFSVQNTRATSAMDSTFTAGVQYIGNPEDRIGTRWEIWHNADWVTLFKDSLAKGQWYRFELEFDYDSNRYLRFSIRGNNCDTTLDLTRSTPQVPEGFRISGERNPTFEQALEVTLEAENLFTECKRATQYRVYYDNVRLIKKMSADFCDDFEADTLNTKAWLSLHASPMFENGKLVLASDLVPPVKSEIQTWREFFYGSLEIVAGSSHWQSDSADRKIDTSIGFETFDKKCHDGIVVTNGTLGVLRAFPCANGECAGDPVFQKYFKIPNWEVLRKTTNKYRIDWSPESISLWVNGQIVLFCVPVPRDSMPIRPMRIRLNCNVDLDQNKGVSKDTLRVDSVCYFAPSPNTEVADAREESQPTDFFLEQNFPNPFNPSTTIRFSQRRAAFVTLKVFNLLGEEVAVLLQGPLPAGKHQARWSANGLAGGIYFYRLQAGKFLMTKKLLLVR